MPRPLRSRPLTGRLPILLCLTISGALSGCLNPQFHFNLGLGQGPSEVIDGLGDDVPEGDIGPDAQGDGDSDVQGRPCYLPLPEPAKQELKALGYNPTIHVNLRQWLDHNGQVLRPNLRPCPD